MKNPQLYIAFLRESAARLEIAVEDPAAMPQCEIKDILSDIEITTKTHKDFHRFYEVPNED